MNGGTEELLEAFDSTRSSVAARSAEAPAALIVHAWDRAQMVADFLERFAGIRGAHLILVIGPEEDFQRFKNAQSSRVTLLYQDHFRKTEAQVAALASTSLDIVVLTDVDCQITQEWLDRLLEPIRNGSEEVVTGPSLPPPTSNPLVRYQLAQYLALIRHSPAYSDGIIGRNAALTRRALVAAGGFNPKIGPGDDYWLGASLLKAGFRIRFLDNPIITDYPGTVSGYLTQQARWLRNILVHGPRIKADRELFSARFTALLSVVFLLSLAAGVVWTPLAFPGLLLWGWGVIRRERRLFRIGRFWTAALLIPFFVILDHLARITGLVQSLVPSWQRSW